MATAANRPRHKRNRSMMSVLVCLVVALGITFVTNPCLAQDTVQISGRIVYTDNSNVLAAQVMLAPFKEGMAFYQADVKGNGSFLFTLPLAEPGFYEVRYAGARKTLLLTANEPLEQVVITVEKNKVQSLELLGSRENKVYDIFKTCQETYKGILKALPQKCATDENACADEYIKNSAVRKALVTSLEQAYKGTFTVNNLLWMAQMPEIKKGAPVLAQIRDHFFDFADLSDKRVFNTPDLSNKLADYIDFIADTSAVARLNLIQRLYDKTNGNKPAQKEFYFFLIEHLIRNKNEPFLQSLVQWVSKQKDVEMEQPVFMSRLNLLKQVLPGEKATEVTGLDLDGGQETLSATAAKGKLTMLVFWESDCAHCIQTMPELIRLYKKYHARGLQVVAASLDAVRQNWINFVDSNNLHWTNINVPPGGSFMSRYYIQYTPTIVLIDRNMNIVRRYIKTEDLDAFFEQSLVQ